MESNTLSGFEAVVGDALGMSMGKETFTANLSDDELMNLVVGNTGPSVAEVFGEEAIKKPEEEKSEEEPAKEDEKTEKPEEQKDNEPAPEDKVEPAATPEDEVEGIQVAQFFDAVAEELNWSLEDDEEKPTTVEGLVDYFKEVIAENSVPAYASSEVQKIDEFVKNGGRLEDYMKFTSEVSYNDIDLTIESNQERVVRDLLTEKGFSTELINSKIQKYKDVGILEDEANEAADLMESIKAEKQEALLEAQKISNQQALEQQQKFVTDVVSEIKNLDNIRGIKIPEKEKKELLNYMFKFDAEGKSQYQREYSNSVRNMVESAYFTKNRDRLLDDAKRDGNNTAMKALKQSLRSTGAARGGKHISTSSNTDIFSRVTKEIFG